MRSHAAAWLFALVASLAAGGCDVHTAPSQEDSIAAVLLGRAEFSALTGALKASAMLDVLAEPGPFTLLAPTNDAFVSLSTAGQQTLMSAANRAILARLLKAHIVPGRLTAADLTDGRALTTLDGTTLHVRREGEAVFVEGARVDLAHLRSLPNGVLMPIDDVLASNLDAATRLMLMPALSTFTRVAGDVGLRPRLASSEAVTVFAPIDDAFRQLGASETLLLNDATNRDVLARVLGLHLVPGRVRLADLASGTVLRTLDGGSLRFTNEGGELRLDGRRVFGTPIETSNGLIYPVASVLLDGLSLWDRIRISADLATFREAVRARPDLVARLSSGEPVTVVAPVAAAFFPTHLNPDVAAALNDPTNAALFDRLIRAHVLEGSYSLEQLGGRTSVPTVNGLTLRTTHLGGVTTIQDRILTPRVESARNGLLYRIEFPVLPPADLFDTAILQGLTQHAQAIRRAGLEATFRGAGPLTLFAPENPYYLAVPGLLNRPDLARFLLYHAAGGALDPLSPGQRFATLLGPTRQVYLDVLVLALEGSGRMGGPYPALNGTLYTVEGLAPPP